MLTAFFIAWPLVSVLLVLLLGNTMSKWTAFLCTVVQLGVTVYALCQFQPDASIQFVMDYPWIEQFGIHFKIGMDGISLLLVLLTNLLMPLIVLSSFKHEYSRPKLFYALALLMQSALVGVFVSLDMFLYYIFWELALVPIYLIILMWGGHDRVKVTYKFFIYTLLGSLFMLVGILFLYFQTPAPHTFDWQAFQSLNLERGAQGWIFWAFFLAFAIKMPVFPFHTWQPDTYTQAPTQGTMLLSGIMLKMGTYSVIRWLLPLVPMGVQDWGRLALILSIVGIVYASWIAITQKDMKRLFAYSSIAHVGLISAGIFTLTVSGLQGSMIQMLSHGINVVGLFFVAQIILDRVKTNQLPSLGGIINQAPVFATLFLIILLGSVALPLTNGFVGEFLLLSGVYQFSPWASAIAGLTIILGAVYMLRTYQSAMLGEVREDLHAFADVRGSEAIVLGVIAALVIVIGIYPKPFQDITEPAVSNLLQSIYHQNLTLK
jgi:NADH-quinone oxidoreductase subunit M